MGGEVGEEREEERSKLLLKVVERGEGEGGRGVTRD